jgi:hypothetical protein
VSTPALRCAQRAEYANTRVCEYVFSTLHASKTKSCAHRKRSVLRRAGAGASTGPPGIAAARRTRRRGPTARPPAPARPRRAAAPPPPPPPRIRPRGRPSARPGPGRRSKLAGDRAVALIAGRHRTPTRGCTSARPGQDSTTKPHCVGTVRASGCHHPPEPVIADICGDIFRWGYRLMMEMSLNRDFAQWRHRSMGISFNGDIAQWRYRLMGISFKDGDIAQ